MRTWEAEFMARDFQGDGNFGDETAYSHSRGDVLGDEKCGDMKWRMGYVESKTSRDGKGGDE